MNKEHQDKIKCLLMLLALARMGYDIDTYHLLAGERFTYGYYCN